MMSKISHWFLLSAGVTLGLTGVAKIISAFGHAKILLLVDPIFSLQFKSLLPLVGSLELMVAVICFVSRGISFRAWLVGWISVGFLAYRTGLEIIHYPRPCSCLGSMASALGLSADTASNVMKVVLAYLLAGSFLVLLGVYYERTRRSPGLVNMPVGNI
jgi:hypothetical protein